MQNRTTTTLAVMGAVFSPLLAQAYEQQPDRFQETQQTQQTQQPYEPGEKVREGQLPAGYNQSASYVCDNSWDVSVTGDYLYWTWNQGALQVGTIITEITDTTINTSATDTAIFNSPGYTSGFQVGMGFNMKGMDNWNLYSEYTWYRNTNDQSFTGTAANPIVLASSEFRADQSFSEDHVTATYDTQSRLGFQALDFLAQRPFYFGKKLTANFSTGLRAQWISQKYTRSNPTETFDNTINTNVSFVAQQTSWSLGPKFALDANWLLGYGIKMLGNIAQSALYTSYNTSTAHVYTRPNGTVASHSTKGLQNYGTISPVTETFLGLAWGSYFCDNAFHVDLSAGYDFNVYWNYDMAYAASSQTEGNMYIHGMNIQLRFDF